LPATRYLALGGIVAPWLWTVVVVLLTVLEYDTLIGYGWTLGNPGPVNYPSSLALGHFGWAATANFGLEGLLTIGFALGLIREVRARPMARIGPVLLGIAGLGMVLSVFSTDHGPANAPNTWHGQIHGISFVVTFVPLLLSFFFLAASFWRDSRWHGFKWLPAVPVVAVATLFIGHGLLPTAISEVSFYVGELVIFVGLTLIGLRLLSLTAAAKVA